MIGRIAALLCVATLTLASCGGDDGRDAEQAVRDYVEAANERDADSVCDELVTESLLERMTGESGPRARKSCKRLLRATTGIDLHLLAIAKTEVDGESAVVKARMRANDRRSLLLLRLEKEDGAWRLAGAGPG